MKMRIIIPHPVCSQKLVLQPALTPIQAGSASLGQCPQLPAAPTALPSSQALPSQLPYVLPADSYLKEQLICQSSLNSIFIAFLLPCS